MQIGRCRRATDDLGRLTGVTWSDGTRSWAYDPIGNVTRLDVDTGLPGEGQVDYAYQVNALGNNTPLLQSVSATSGGSPLWTSTLSTDPAGNITTDGVSTYTYDLRNHLGSRQLPAATSQHTFDASGRRVETTRSDTGTTTELILGPTGQRLAKLDATAWRDYVWLGNRLIAYFDQGDTDPTLVFTNHIGMPLLATDGTGAPVWEAKAEPYGQLRGTVNRTHDPALRYPGQKPCQSRRSAIVVRCGLELIDVETRAGFLRRGRVPRLQPFGAGRECVRRRRRGPSVSGPSS